MTNKQLQALFTLDCSIKIYIPSTHDVTTPIDNKKHVDDVLGKFADLFGGATSYRATGAWRSTSNAQLILEKVTIVESFCDTEKLTAQLDKVIELAQSLRDEMKQEAIAVEVNGKLGFI